MQATSRFHHQIIKSSPQVAKDGAHNMVNLDTTNTVLNADALAGNAGILCFLFGCQLSAFGFLLGLKGLHLLRVIALKTGILPQLAAWWKAHSVFIGHLLVMGLALPGGTERFDLAGAFITDDVVLDRVPFLLAAVVAALLVGVFGTTDRAFRAVDDELQTRTGRQNLADVSGLTHWQLALVAQGLVEDRCQTMNPLVGLRLPHPEHIPLHNLHRVEFEVEQDEHQLIFQTTQRARPTTAPSPLAWCRTLPVAPIQIGFIRLGKGRQQLVKGRQCQPGETAENRRLVFQARKGNHQLLSIVLNSDHSIPILFNPIESIIERRQAEERADFLYRLTAALSHAVTPEQIADIVIDEGLTFFDVYRAGLVLFSEERKTARIIKHYGVESDILEQYEEIKISDPNTPVFEVVRTGQPVWISSLEEYQERYPELARTIHSERRVEAFICLPLAVNDELAGCLFASFFPPMHLNESNRTFLLTLAEQCALTLERARLYRDEQQARVEAEEANRLKLQLLAMISHELRTPLTSIKGFASTLLEPDVQWEGENHREFISIINEEADKLTELVDQLLDLSRLQAGALHITPNNHSVGDIVNTARPQLSSLTRDHRFTIEVPEDLPQVFADLQRIAQVITNLVANSAHYSPAGTSITLSAHLQNDCVQIDVSDEGVGIAPEDRALVFEAFRQAERKGEGHHRGAGLGLAICKGLVEAQGGRIWIQDEVRTRTGTTISFTLLIYEGE
jgi:signal transduction histidine kinase